ncbi:ABC transporter permease [Paenibacillus tarimensis]|uniref:ABC transporter permease n=1 Tax=Paenibacillus tarimensis TaxID=416012 RepID=UPI001F38683A|nr:ABC transporter permease [Paenibacillus tarimensis]MCF2942171.1 ABC transporter permease [Paenibacillus tarimensis]
MRTAIYSTLYELLRMTRMRSVLLMLFALPLLLIFLLGYGLDTTIRPVDVTVYIGDDGMLGERSREFFEADETGEHIQVKMVSSQDEVEKDIRAGASDYGIAVPADFTEQFMAGSGKIVTYPGKLMERNMAAETVLSKLTGQFETGYLSEAMGVPIPEREVPEEGYVQTGTIVANGNAEFGPVSSLQYYASAYLVMFLLFSGMAAAISMMEEKEYGTLSRLLSLPLTLSSFLLGKFIAYIIIAVIQSAVIVLFTRYVYGVDWGGNYGVILLTVLLTSLSAICLSVIIASIVRSRKAVESVFSMVAVIMTFLSGGMMAGLGPVIETAGRFTINHWANELLKTVMTGGVWSELQQPLLVLAAIAAGFILLMLTRIRKAVV